VTGKTRGPGRPPDPRREAAILAAALDGLAELGYDRLSMEEIAARAHAGKATLYRRWPSKAALIVDAVVAWREGVAPLVLPDTGSLVGDLEALAETFPDFDAPAQQQLAVIIGLVGAASHDEALRTALFTHGFDRPRRALLEILQRAADRGEVPDTRDVDLLTDIVLGFSMMRMLRGATMDRALARRMIFDVLYPLATAPRSDSAAAHSAGDVDRRGPTPRSARRRPGQGTSTTHG